MKFCTQCESLLLIEHNGDCFIYRCKNCPHVAELEDYIETVEFEQSNENIIDNDMKKYASVCTKQCSRCKNMKAAYFEMQTRSADEPMTVFYKCTNCQHTWKE